MLASTILAVATTAGVVIAGDHGGVRHRALQLPRPRGFLYTLFAAGLMFPLTVAALPLTLLLRTLGLHGTYLGVIIPAIAFALPTTIIILVPFLRAIPAELEEAAVIDGATRIGFFWRILLPLSKPGLVTVGILAFVGSWNGYLLPLLVISTGSLPQELWPLPLGRDAVLDAVLAGHRRRARLHLAGDDPGARVLPRRWRSRSSAASPGR